MTTYIALDTQSRQLVVWTAATFRGHPVDVLTRVFDVAGLAADAVLRVYLESLLAWGLFVIDVLVNAGLQDEEIGQTCSVVRIQHGKTSERQPTWTESLLGTVKDRQIAFNLNRLFLGDEDAPADSRHGSRQYGLTKLSSSSKEILPSGLG